MLGGIGAVVLREPGQRGVAEWRGRPALAGQQRAQHAGQLLRLELALPFDFLQQAFGLLDRGSGEAERSDIEAASPDWTRGPGSQGKGCENHLTRREGEYIQDVYTEAGMENSSDNRLREAPATFNLDGAPGLASNLRMGEVKHYRAKVFKSGNSLALRLPAALGLEAGMEMELTVGADGSYGLKPADAPKRKIDVSKFAGKAPWLKELPRYDFEDSPRDWHLLGEPESDA